VGGDRDLEFGRQVDRSKNHPSHDKPSLKGACYVKSHNIITPLKGCGLGHLAHFFKFCPNYIFGIGEARHFKFCMLINTQEYLCMRDILPPKGMCSESRDLFTFLEINHNISLTVPCKDINAKEG